MHIQVSTDHNIDGNERFVRHVEAELRTALSGFNGDITRVEVHFSDENGAEAGGVVAISSKCAPGSGSCRGRNPGRTTPSVTTHRTVEPPPAACQSPIRLGASSTTTTTIHYSSA